MSTLPNINDVLDGHAVLDLTCLDRIYLNGYVPNLQTSGQVVHFLRDHLGKPIASPALFDGIGRRFREAVNAFAEEHQIPVLRLNKPDRTRWDDRKLDHVQPYLKAAREPGVVAIVVSQEFQRVFTAYKRPSEAGLSSFTFEKADRRVSTYYFYILDEEFGPGFIKICSYFPYPVKVWVNGHEWAKRQARKTAISFAELANGFSSCEQPELLQAICNALGPEDLARYFERWLAVIPRPLTDADRRAGFWWDLSMRQVEVSRTIVLDDPRRARAFFESLVADNIGIGRPQQVSMVFGRRVTKKTPGIFRTRVFEAGTDVRLDVQYKKSRLKQYLKEGRGIRIEAVFNDPYDVGVKRRLEHLPELFQKGREIAAQLLMIERAGQGCATGSALFERIQLPYVREGRRTGALRFGDKRAMALAGALCLFVHAVNGFTNKSLRCLVAELLAMDYSAAQMTYDLRRLRLHGLIERLPGTHTYTVTPDGLRVALFYTKVYGRLLTPLLAAHGPPREPRLTNALRAIDSAVADYVTNARLGAAA